MVRRAGMENFKRSERRSIGAKIGRSWRSCCTICEGGRGIPMWSRKARLRKWVGELWENQIKQIKTWNRFKKSLAVTIWHEMARESRNLDAKVYKSSSRNYKEKRSEVMCWFSSLLNLTRLSHWKDTVLSGQTSMTPVCLISPKDFKGLNTLWVWNIFNLRWFDELLDFVTFFCLNWPQVVPFWSLYVQPTLQRSV